MLRHNEQQTPCAASMQGQHVACSDKNGMLNAWATSVHQLADSLPFSPLLLQDASQTRSAQAELPPQAGKRKKFLGLF